MRTEILAGNTTNFIGGGGQRTKADFWKNSPMLCPDPGHAPYCSKDNLRESEFFRTCLHVLFRVTRKIIVQRPAFWTRLTETNLSHGSRSSCLTELCLNNTQNPQQSQLPGGHSSPADFSVPPPPSLPIFPFYRRIFAKPIRNSREAVFHMRETFLLGARKHVAAMVQLNHTLSLYICICIYISIYISIYASLSHNLCFCGSNGLT